MDRTPSDAPFIAEAGYKSTPNLPPLPLLLFFFPHASMYSLIMNANTPAHREPRWVWLYGTRRGLLSHAITVFDKAVSKKFDQDSTFKYLIGEFGMKLSCFSFLQGPTDPAVTQWFMPDRKVQFHPRVDVNKRQNSFFTLHDKLRSSTKSEHKKNEELGRALSQELNNFSLAARSNQRFKPVE